MPKNSEVLQGYHHLDGHNPTYSRTELLKTSRESEVKEIAY